MLLIGYLKLLRVIMRRFESKRIKIPAATSKAIAATVSEVAWHSSNDGFALGNRPSQNSSCRRNRHSLSSEKFQTSLTQNVALSVPCQTNGLVNPRKISIKVPARVLLLSIGDCSSTQGGNTDV